MIKIGIISDIHSHKEGKGDQGGYYYPNMPESPASKNPFASLKKLLRADKKGYDYILCPGDLAHQIDLEGLKSSWDQLKIIKNEVQAVGLVATIGNHDVSSRANGQDVFKALKEFDADFPVYMSADSQNFRTQLLNQGYYVLDDNELDTMILVINSCFDHWTKVEASKGKIETESLLDIQKSIKSSQRKRKIALIHHQPIVHETGVHDTGDLIEGCEELMKSLSGVDLIIHGHKHDFRFTQIVVYPKNLNILSAGSFSCFKTYLKNKSLNYFHEVEFHPESITDCKNQGIVKTYSYDPTSGWSPEEILNEGFGCTLTVHELKENLKGVLISLADYYVEWSELVAMNPVLKYISKTTRDQVLGILKEEGVIKRYNTTLNGIGDLILK